MFDINEIRSHFPALESGDIFFDGPGGTQVPQKMIEAMIRYYRTSNANAHGAFITSRRTDKVTSDARSAMADFLNARSDDEIVFGPNMTTLTYNLSRAIGGTLKPGDEIIVTRLDHDANIRPWVALEERGAVIRWIEMCPEDCTLDLMYLEKYLSEKTKLVAVGYSSNAFGTVNRVKSIAARAHAAGALVFVDAVHYAAHASIDVQDIDCDFLACSAYKFFGPHLGVLYGKFHILDHLPAYKVIPARNAPPDKFETGTQNFEAQAGVTATMEYLASIGRKNAVALTPDHQASQGRRLELHRVMTGIHAYESTLFSLMMDGLNEIPGITIYGITDRTRFDERVPTVAFTMNGATPRAIAERLAHERIYVWDGHYYAVEPMRYLGLLDKGGAVRVGLSFYNTRIEVQRFLSVLHQMAGTAE